MRRTKIVATLGPATDSPKILKQLILAGVDTVRLNYSHGTHEDQEKRVKQVFEVTQKMGRHIGIMADLQGPKIRIASFKEGFVVLDEGDEFDLDSALKEDAGDEHQVGLTYKNLVNDVKKGDNLLLDDGRIILQVERIRDTRIKCIVLLGGRLSNNKGLNKEGGGLSAKALTTKDRRDLRHAISLGVDFIALSFPRDAKDVEGARRLIKKEGGECRIIAKMERAEAIENETEIIEAADAIMIARGDLGVEIGDAALPPVQKRLIKKARRMNRAVITATQMMESMIENHIPTRAEVFDVANAVLDGTDAVMLSAETSIGKYPVKVVEAMARIISETERQRGSLGADYRIEQKFDEIDETIAMSTMYAANHMKAKAIIALTETGSTTKWMSRTRSGIPIFAFTRTAKTCRRITLFRGVYPFLYDITGSDFLEVNKEMIEILKDHNAVVDDDVVIITKGDLQGSEGGTNVMKIVRVGQLVAHRS
ncbi:MAG: pyruvate kinase [Gammaproteobacteria bacterium]